MNILAHLLSILPMVPAIVQGIEVIHGNALNGAAKKDLAMQALGLSTAVAQQALPEQKPAIDAATNLASTTIDGVVALLKATGAMPKPAPGVAPAPVKA